MEKLTKEVLAELNNAWLTKYLDHEPDYNPLDILRTDDNDEFEKKFTWLLMQPDYFSFLCKHIFNVSILPFQGVILSELWQRKFPMLIASRGAGKSFLLALYSLMRAFLIPNRKVIIAGAAFRQSRFVHEYMETIWKNAPVLRDLCDSDSGAFKSPDMCRMIINGSTVTSIPIGTGEKIRGYRCNDLITEEFACLTSDSIIQTDIGLITISNYLKGDAYALLNKDHELEVPDKIFKTPKVDVYRVITQNGYSFKCSAIHQVMSSDGWKLAKDLTDKDHLVLDMNDYFPEKNVSHEGVVLDEKLAWLIGILISEGCVTNRNNIQITNTDKELIDKILLDYSELTWGITEKEPYVDKRGFDCKRSWSLLYSNTEYRTMLSKFGVVQEIAINKTIPIGILQSPRSVILSFLSGLFEGDGSCFYYTHKGKKHIGVSYYTGSKQLAEEIHVLLLKFGIVCSNTKRQTNALSHRRGHMVAIRGKNAFKLFNLLKILKWKDKFDTAFFHCKKPYIRKVTKKTTRYYLSTSILNKNKHLGSFSSEEEAIKTFNNYLDSEPKSLLVKSVELLPEQEHLYDFHMPQTHSFIANGFVQHNSHSREIFETVLAGFGNVSSLPVDVVRRIAAEEEARNRGIDISLLGGDGLATLGNQIVLCGTAIYDFNHFADYWKKWKKIINSKGIAKNLRDIFPDGIPENFKWSDYSVIRLPYDALPKGFLDDGNIARSKASVHSGIFEMEMGTVFSKDSKGFFKRSLIESCVANENNNLMMPSGPVVFDAMIKGNSSKRYIIGVDPASEIDNFCIVVIELNEDHRRVVHCWTTTRETHSERVRMGLTTEDNFYSYCARRIRELMRAFPTERIMLDSQGGGIAVNEALHETSNLLPGEVLIWPVIDEDKEKPTDDEVGLHLVELVNFADAKWTSEANHGLRKDFEDKVLLFPKFDPVILGLAAEEDKANNKLYDTLEDCVMELEEMKTELSLIEISKTPNGRDRWDTPEFKVGANKKKKLRKDRYSSLLMANMGARNYTVKGDPIFQSYGGFSHTSVGKKAKMEYVGPQWFIQGIKDVYDGY